MGLSESIGSTWKHSILAFPSWVSYTLVCSYVLLWYSHIRFSYSHILLSYSPCTPLVRLSYSHVLPLYSHCTPSYSLYTPIVLSSYSHVLLCTSIVLTCTPFVFPLYFHRTPMYSHRTPMYSHRTPGVRKSRFFPLGSPQISSIKDCSKKAPSVRWEQGDSKKVAEDGMRKVETGQKAAVLLLYSNVCSNRSCHSLFFVFWSRWVLK